MPNLSLWFGLFSAAGLLAWSLLRPGAAHNIVDLHGVLIVLGGLSAAMLVNTPAAHLFSALRTFFWVVGPQKQPTLPEVSAEILRLCLRARAEGGLLALRDQTGDFADGFLRRAVEAAAACGETDATREILDVEIRRRRLRRQEDANVFRTMGMLAPMFGLLGTLVGMLQVLTSMSEPTKLGPAMALALSSAFIGIGLANFFCVPIAGQIRLMSMHETQVLEMIIAGILEISLNRPAYQVELKLGAYYDGAGAPAAAAVAPAAASAPNEPVRFEEREEDLENQLNRGALWAVTYGDLMSYLMIFFLMLYVAASTRGVGLQMSIKAAEQRFSNDANTVEQLFTRYGTQKIAHLEVGENKIRIVFMAPVLFDSASAQLKPDSLPVLQQIVQSLSELPNPIQIEGHTDDRPLGRGSKFDSNWELSAARAFAVLRYLEISGIPQQRLSAIGYGEFRPRETNDTVEGRLANRRIEINIIRRED